MCFFFSKYACKITKNSLYTKYFLKKNCFFSEKKRFFRILVYFLCDYSAKK